MYYQLSYDMAGQSLELIARNESGETWNQTLRVKDIDLVNEREDEPSRSR